MTKKNITLEILPPLYAVMNGVVQKVGLKLTVYSSGIHSVVGLKITFKSFLTFKTTVAQSITFLLLLVALLFCKGVRYSLLLIRTDPVLQLFPGFFSFFFFYSSAQFRYRSVTDLTPY